MEIGHYKETIIAYAPEAICEVINKYTDHHAYVFGIKTSLKQNTEIVHQHNKDTFNFHKKIIQYHSEPFRVTLDVKIPKLVISQYHATLPEYAGCTIVRNPINIFDKIYIPKYNDKKIRIGYSPSSDKVTSIWADKGYKETIPILEQLKKQYKDLIEVDIIIGVSLDECLKRKSMCNIFIDEVKTASYHRSGLESLGMGILSICSVSKDVEKVFLKSSGATKNPFVNVYHNELFKTLSLIIEKGLDEILLQGWYSRNWMETNWNPQVIAEEYIKIYKKIKK
jgi:hypothetical protein